MAKRRSLDSLRFITVKSLPVCEGCFAGVGGQCHSPGCFFWLSAAPDLPLRDKLKMHGARISTMAGSGRGGSD